MHTEQPGHYDSNVKQLCIEPSPATLNRQQCLHEAALVVFSYECDPQIECSTDADIARYCQILHSIVQPLSRMLPLSFTALNLLSTQGLLLMRPLWWNTVLSDRHLTMYQALSPEDLNGTRSHYVEWGPLSFH